MIKNLIFNHPFSILFHYIKAIDFNEFFNSEIRILKSEIKIILSKN